MSWSRISDAAVETSFSKSALTNYIAAQKEHKALMEGRLNRQFNNTYIYTGAGTALGLFGPVGVGAAVIVNVLNQFYANDLSKTIDTVKSETTKGLAKLEAILAAWKTDYVSVKVYIPVMRFQSTTGTVVHLAAGSGVRQISATLKSGITIGS